MNDIGAQFLKSIIKRSEGYKLLGDKTFAQLNDADMQFQPNAESNSIATIVQHMAGNMISRWTDFLTTDGEKEWRNRDDEFENNNASKDDVLSFWEKGWNCYLTALNNLSEADLLKTIYIRNEPLLVIDAVNRQLAHYPYHVGQIVFIGKMIKNEAWNNLSMPKKVKS